jgi:hypothetical protein
VELTLGVILDELTDYNPIVHKNAAKNNKFKQFRLFDAAITGLDPLCLYIVNSANLDASFSQICPKHLIGIGDTIDERHCPPAEYRPPAEYITKADTYIQLRGAVSPETLLQIGFTVFQSYEAWNQAMLLAIINRTSVGRFLEITAQKLTNPIALLDNGSTRLAEAGQFSNSATGTIWEKTANPGFVLTDFFTVSELRELGSRNPAKSGRPSVYRLSIDKGHTYASSSIWINEQQYGSIGLVDINAPFTEGQLDIISHISEILKLYFKNNDFYLQMVENKVHYIDSLLEGADISGEIVSYHLQKMNWKLNDEFCVVAFDCPVEFTSPVESISYIKLIARSYPKAQIALYQNKIIMIMRIADYSLVRRGKEQQKLERFLSDNDMRCGISTAFGDFMRLRYYYVQSCFAREQCGENAGTLFLYYEDCYHKHILKSLAQSADLRCFCHPKILALWDSGDEGRRELVRSLYQYLLNGGNIASTAEHLHVHRNTFIYRLHKLSEILDTDLKGLSPDQTFFYLFSCMIVGSR